MKKLISIYIFLLCGYNFYSQSNFSLNFSTGTLAIKKDFGLNYDFGLGYKITPKVQVNVEIMMSQLDKKEYDLEYDFQKYSLNVNYNFLPENNFSLNSIFGFSLINFDKTLEMVNNNGLGIDIGFICGFNQDKNFSYGFKLISTYNSISNGGILQSNLFFKYNL